MAESRPDPFIRYDYPRLLDESRAAVASVIKAPVEGVVFVSNATVGVNTVFRNLAWDPDGKDVVLTFSTSYEACAKVVDHAADTTGGRVEHRQIDIPYPIEDDEVLRRLGDAVQQIVAEGKHARACMYDIVSSRPGVLFPWERATALCRELGVLSIVDGAQGVGMVPIDVGAADPDFFVSNCHKWLFAPRGCAVFYVPERNHHLLPTTLAVSHGYAPKLTQRTSPLPPSGKSAFVSKFEFCGTMDNAPYLCVKDAVAWRKEVLGGEEAIIEYLWDLNKKGSKIVAEALGTHVMENEAGTLTNSAMANVALPIWHGAKGPDAADGDVALTTEESPGAFQWMLRTMKDDYKTFMSLFIHRGRYWVRISAQVYLDLEDYVWVSGVLKELCQRVAREEFRLECLPSSRIRRVAGAGSVR